MKLIGKKYIKEFILELVMTIAFMLIVQFFSRWMGFAVYASIVLVYLIINRKNIISLFKTVKNLISRKKDVNSKGIKQ